MKDVRPQLYLCKCWSDFIHTWYELYKYSGSVFYKFCFNRIIYSGVIALDLWGSYSEKYKYVRPKPYLCNHWSDFFHTCYGYNHSASVFCKFRHNRLIYRGVIALDLVENYSEKHEKCPRSHITAAFGKILLILGVNDYIYSGSVFRPNCSIYSGVIALDLVKIDNYSANHEKITCICSITLRQYEIF